MTASDGLRLLGKILLKPTILAALIPLFYSSCSATPHTSAKQETEITSDMTGHTRQDTSTLDTTIRPDTTGYARSVQENNHIEQLLARYASASNAIKGADASTHYLSQLKELLLSTKEFRYDIESRNENYLNQTLEQWITQEQRKPIISLSDSAFKAWLANPHESDVYDQELNQRWLPYVQSLAEQNHLPLYPNPSQTSIDHLFAGNQRFLDLWSREKKQLSNPYESIPQYLADLNVAVAGLNFYDTTGADMLRNTLSYFLDDMERAKTPHRPTLDVISQINELGQFGLESRVDKFYK
ncbi:MAG: hypothetical protein V1725_00545 [archaeon]